MFDSLSGRLTGIFDRLKKRGALTEADVTAALREVRIALLEADVALPVVKQFIDSVRTKAVGEAVLKSVTPAQQVIKIVHDALVEMLGPPAPGLDLRGSPPFVVLMLGLQGSGKTTTAGKIALRLKQRDRKRVLLASLDVSRPAAMEQLAMLADRAGVISLPIVRGETPLQIAGRALDEARRGGFDVLILDTAGRLAIDEALMAEVAEVAALARPHEKLLVVDAMTGQDAVTVAKSFHEKVGVTGIVMTRMDGDARGGAALSMRALTGAPIRLLGVGEKLDALEDFHPDRIAGRILGMGDIVSLVERAAATIEAEEAERLSAKIAKGGFDLEDYRKQLAQITKMGSLSSLLTMIPGLSKLQGKLAEAQLDDKLVKRQIAIIDSMTREERRRPEIIKASRKRRIAAGSGTKVEDVNRLLKQFDNMQTMMKRMQKLGKTGIMRGGLGALLPPGVGLPGSGRRPF